MKTTINTRTQGDVTFSRPGNRYVFADMNNQPGTLGVQICDGGRLQGNTIAYRGDDAHEFARLCRSWWRQYLCRMRENR